MTNVDPLALPCRRVDDLEAMLALYYDAIRAVPESEQELLTKLLQELEDSLTPGFNVLNWNSLGIADFDHQCRKAINEFNTRVGQVMKNKRDIEALVASISNANLVPENDSADVPSLQVRATLVSLASHTVSQMHALTVGMCPVQEFVTTGTFDKKETRGYRTLTDSPSLYPATLTGSTRSCSTLTATKARACSGVLRHDRNASGDDPGVACQELPHHPAAARQDGRGGGWHQHRAVTAAS